MEKKDKALTDKSYWQDNYGSFQPVTFWSDLHHHLAEPYVKDGHGKKALEIGAYPGHNLGWYAKAFGYTPVALDFVDEIENIRRNMEHNGVMGTEIIKADFLKWRPPEQYDLVMSHGFVEHFTNYEEVIDRHVAALKPGGYLILSVPYLEYFQLWMRQWLYTPAQLKKILDSHNRRVMNREELERIIFKKHGLEKLQSGFVMNATIWFDMDPKTTRQDRRWLFRFGKLVEKAAARLRVSNRFVSPEIFIIARKLT
jgi:2-polyprenyl-3-methyl-5-hydroxy-6-metoxy-1,4-benzoquinol methylase